MFISFLICEIPFTKQQSTDKEVRANDYTTASVEKKDERFTPMMAFVQKEVNFDSMS